MYAQQLHIIQSQMVQIEPRMKAYLDAALQKAAINRDVPAPAPAELETVVNKVTQLESAVNKVTQLESAVNKVESTVNRLIQLESTVSRLESAMNKLESDTKIKFAQTAASLELELNTEDIIIEERKKTKRGGGGAGGGANNATKKNQPPTVELECA